MSIRPVRPVRTTQHVQQHVECKYWNRVEHDAHSYRILFGAAGDPVLFCQGGIFHVANGAGLAGGSGTVGVIASGAGLAVWTIVVQAIRIVLAGQATGLSGGVLKLTRGAPDALLPSVSEINQIRKKALVSLTLAREDAHVYFNHKRKTSKHTAIRACICILWLCTVVGTGKCNTSTTNMHQKDGCDVLLVKPRGTQSTS